MLNKGADHTTIAMHDQPARKPLSSSVNRVKQTYEDEEWPTVERQLQRGGVRLARILNDTLQ